MSKKERQRRQFAEQLHLTNDRGNTFVGLRPVTFASKKHPSRAKRKDVFRKEGEDA